MTLAEIEAYPKDVLTCQQISGCLGAHYHTIHHQAMMNPAKLGFPVICMNSRVYIPTEAFIKFMEGRKADV